MTANDLHYEYCLSKLRINPLFENLDDETLESLMGCLSLKKWNKNSEFFYGDQTFYKFFIIISGRLKMYQIDIDNGREFTVFLLTQNDVFDVVSLLDGLKHSMNFETIDDVEVLYAPIDLMRDWIENHPKINKTLLPYLGRCMRMLEVNLTDNVLSDIPTRLASSAAERSVSAAWSATTMRCSVASESPFGGGAYRPDVLAMISSTVRWSSGSPRCPRCIVAYCLATSSSRSYSADAVNGFTR